MIGIGEKETTKVANAIHPMTNHLFLEMDAYNKQAFIIMFKPCPVKVKTVAPANQNQLVIIIIMRLNYIGIILTFLLFGIS